MLDDERTSKGRRKSRRESRYRIERRRSTGASPTEPNQEKRRSHESHTGIHYDHQRKRASPHRISRDDPKRSHSKESHRDRNRRSTETRNDSEKARAEETARQTHTRRMSKTSKGKRLSRTSRRSRSYSKYLKHRLRLKKIIKETPRTVPANAVSPTGEMPQQLLQQRKTKTFNPLCSMKSCKIKNACKWMFLAELIFGVSNTALKLITIAHEMTHIQNTYSDEENAVNFLHTNLAAMYWLDVVFCITIAACGIILLLGTSMTLKIPCILHSATATLGVIIQVVAFTLTILSWDPYYNPDGLVFFSMLLVYRFIWILAMIFAAFLSYVLYSKISFDDDIANLTLEKLKNSYII